MKVDAEQVPSAIQSEDEQIMNWDMRNMVTLPQYALMVGHFHLEGPVANY